MAPTPEQIAAVRVHLPPDAETANGWTDAKIIERWQGSPFRTVREFWLDRVNETAAYIDLSNEGLPASQIHAQAKAMLAYWDEILKSRKFELGLPTGAFSRKIKRV